MTWKLDCERDMVDTLSVYSACLRNALRNAQNHFLRNNRLRKPSLYPNSGRKCLWYRFPVTFREMVAWQASRASRYRLPSSAATL